MKKGDVGLYMKLLQKRAPLILLVSVLAALVAYGVVNRVKPSHIVHFSYVVSLVQRDTAPEFRFDGFYAIQATDLFASTLASWMKTPEQIVAAYQEAGLELPASDAREILKAVEATKTGPQLVQVAVKNATKEKAESLAQGLQTVVEKQVATYHDKGTPAIAFRVVADTPWTSLQKLPIKMIVSGTFVFVFLFLLNAVLLFESVKRLP